MGLTDWKKQASVLSSPEKVRLAIPRKVATNHVPEKKMARRTKLEIADEAGRRVANDWPGDDIPYHYLMMLAIANEWNEKQLVAFKSSFDQLKALQESIYEEESAGKAGMAAQTAIEPPIPSQTLTLADTPATRLALS